MNDSPLISVIVPAYNAEEYLEQCIESLLNQSYKNLEIIVIDDGSTDNTAQIVKQYPIVQYLHQHNKGLSATRNRGIELANGEYIHFMDADDLLTLDFYEKMVKAATETHSDMACSGFHFERFPNQSQIIHHRLLFTHTEDKIKATNVCNYAACWRYLFKLSFLRNNKLSFEDGRVAEDRIFSIQAVHLANKIVTVPHVLYIYKNRKNAITTSKDYKLTRKRHEDRKYADRFQSDYAKQHQFHLDRSHSYQHWQFKLLGIPLLTKRVYHAGKTRWYFLCIPIFQKKEVDIW